MQTYPPPSWFCPSCGHQNQLSFKHCTECGTALPSGAATSATSVQSIITEPVKRKNSPVFWWFIGICGGILVLGLWVGALRESSKVGSSDTRSTAEMLKSSAPSALPFPSATDKPSVWRYAEDTDSMSGKKQKVALVTSTNTVNFGFPYQGTQHATLTVRKHPRYGNDVLLEIEKGQFLAGVSGVQVLARFDDGPAMKLWARGAEDNSSNILFLGSYPKFTAALRKAKIVRISTSIYHEGSPVFIFDVGGFEDR